MTDNKRWTKLVLGAVILFFAGIIYAWSVIKAPFASEFGWGTTELGLNYTLTMCFFCLGGFISGLVAKKVSAKIRMAISGLLVFAGFFITSTLNGNNPVLLYLGYGVMAGLGIGIVYNIAISLTSSWFQDKKGICSGVLMMAFGFSSFVLGKLADKLFKVETFGWRKVYLVYGIVIGAIIIIGGLLIKGYEQNNAGDKEFSDEGEFTTLQMVKRASFWQIFVFILLVAAVGGIALSFGKDVILSFDNSESAQSLAVTIASMLAILNGLGRISSGAIFDKLGVRKTQLITSAVAIAAPLVTYLGLVANVKVVGIIGVCLCGFSYGFAPTVGAAMIGAFYGKKSFSLNFAMLNLNLIPSAFYATIVGKLLDSGGTFATVFLILVICSVVGLVDNIFIKKA